MALKLQEFTSGDCKIVFDDRLLLQYTAVSKQPSVESPKPFFHPVHTLRGTRVTDFAPADHTWHHGIAFAPTYINGDTFWGGPSFVLESHRYESLKNQGRQEHLAWEILTSNANCIAWKQRLAWRNHAEVQWIEEERHIQIDLPLGAVGSWRLSFEFLLHNVSGRELVFESPVCRGRPEGGYFGLMWRGAPELANGRVFTEKLEDGAATMGSRASWLAYVAPAANVTLLFLDHPKNPRYPNPWFERHGDCPLVSYALAYHEPYILARDTSLALRYQIVVADGMWTREDATAFAAKSFGGDT